MKYRVLTEWLTLTGTIPAGGEVELPEHEAAPFLGRVLEPVETPAEEPVETPTIEVLTETPEPVKPNKKKAST